jgi:ribose transport system permease protein
VSSTPPTTPDPETTPSVEATTPAAPGAGEAALEPQRRTSLGRQLSRGVFEAESGSVLIALGLVLGLFAVTHPGFFSTHEIQNVLQNSVYVGVIALGMTFLIAMRQLDLSVSSILALTAAIGALLMNQGWNPWLAALAALGCAGLMGLVNGFLVQTLRINALLATLATLFAYNGLNQGLNASNTVIIGYTNNDVPIKGNHALHNSFFTALGGNILSVPIAFWLMVAFAIVLTIVLRFTPFGYRVRSIGSNPEAAKFSGISIPRVTYQAFLLAGVVAGLAGLLVLIFFQDADPTVGGSDNLLAIAAVIIGGTPMRGGTGTVIGAMVGAVLLSGVIQSGLTYFSISENWTQFALGVVILAAVSVDSVVRAGRRRA